MDSGPRQLEDMRRLFDAGCDAARNDLDRIEQMLARMDRIEAMFVSDSDSAAADGAPAGRPRSMPAPEREGSETQARQTPAATERRGGRASLRDSPLAHLFRPTN